MSINLYKNVLIFMLFFLMISIFSVKDLYAVNVTISGRVDQMGNPVKAVVQIVKPGFPLMGQSPEDASWVLLGETSSSSTDGSYTLTVDAAGKILVLAFYDGLSYSINKQLDIVTQTDVSGINISLPVLDKNSISADIRVYEGPVGQELEINYRSRQHQILVVTDPQNIDGGIVDITNYDYRQLKKNMIYDLPDGLYTVICALNINGGAGFKYTVGELLLPISDPNKIHNIYFR